MNEHIISEQSWLVIYFHDQFQTDGSLLNIRKEGLFDVHSLLEGAVQSFQHKPAKKPVAGKGINIRGVILC